MKAIAVTDWAGLVSPLYDAAARVLVDNGDGQLRWIDITGRSLTERTNLLAAHNAGTVICGAISVEALALLRARKIEVVPWIRGSVAEVLGAYRKGLLTAGPCSAVFPQIVTRATNIATTATPYYSSAPHSRESPSVRPMGDTT